MLILMLIYVSELCPCAEYVIFELTRAYDEDRCTTKYIKELKLRLHEAFNQDQTAAKMFKNRKPTMTYEPDQHH